jgi:hypothetical protein
MEINDKQTTEFLCEKNEDTKWGGVRRHMDIEDRQCNGQ